MTDTENSSMLRGMVSASTPRAPSNIALFTRADALAAGLSDRDLRTSIYQRVIHGVYTSAEHPLTHELKCRAAAMTLPNEAIITARSAATLHGVPLAGRHDDVEVLVSGHKYMNRRSGLRCWARMSREDEHVEWQGIQVASPYRSALDLLSLYPLKLGVANCDALLHAGFIEEDRLALFLTTRNYYGMRKARAAFELLDARAESVPESVLRITLVQSGLVPTPQVEIHHGNEFVARVDLAYESEKVAVEYEGAWHGDPQQHRRDQVRLQRLRDCGWHVVIVTAERLYRDPSGVADEVRTVLRHRR
ncbi:DUF559 domain-containing protein [Haloactinomyces albus]|uniref:Very-short-patch-repair endonuclease n=1 Tax=Haloactinomyces albus TaxID=1352928 RepID=A0AAE4CNX0_9ACTN|nr:DUF559 domain-containing protein [Haloactinomyces albus]MDR7302502.1 very-short-patch-repair endonuclease [Haloactinomyces albus]